jgi:putative transposase
MVSFFRSLKTEWVSSTGYQDFKETNNSIIDHIIGYYSQVRPHQYNGGLKQNE